MNGPSLHLSMLVIDDDDVDRERVRRLLERSPLDADIKEAASGAEALELIRTHAFDCVVLDNHLGDTSGAELLPKLHQEAYQDCPIIMITGAGSESLAVRAMQDGASDYLAKTQLSAEGLVRSVRRSLQHHRLQNELGAMHQQLEQRVQEQAATIRQRERDLRALVDNAPTVMGYWNREQRCRYGNQTLGEWFGFEPQDLLGSRLVDVVGAELYAACWPALQVVLSGGAQSFETPISACDGRPERHAQVQLRPDIADDGAVLGFYVTMTDVTQIKAAQAQTEELLSFSEAVIENSPIGIAVFRANGICMLANAALVEACGESIETLRSRDFRQLPGWQSCGLVDAACATLGDGAARRVEAVLQKAGREVRLACALARLDSGSESRLLFIAQDITEQGLAHAALVAARDAATSAARAKSAFLANMSHEIRTPMNAIVGLSRLALEDDLPPVARDYLDNVHTSATALMGILDDVLDYSKIEAGHMHFDHIRFDLEGTMYRVADLFRARIEQKGLSFNVEFGPGVPRYVMGDPLRLSQVLNNLVGNAVKFTEKGYIHVSVDVAEDQPTQKDVMLSFAVADTGMGLDAQRCAALFEAFVQGDNSITRRFGGTGLGLAICKQLVQMMGGEIGVDSEPGKGSRFWFVARLEPAAVLPACGAARPTWQESGFLPIEGQVGAVAVCDPAARSPSLKEMAAPLLGAHVLLAEDNRLNQIVAMEFLRRAGLEVTVVDNGAAAVEAVLQAPAGQFAAVLMDMHMPVLDGLEATRRIRAGPGGATLPIIGMTAAVLPEDRARCFEVGMVDHIPKPIIPENLIRILLQWISPDATRVSASAGHDDAAAVQRPSDADVDLARLDLALLRERLFGNEALLWRILATFVEQEADTGNVLAVLLEQGHLEQALHKVHDLKGTSANLGAVMLSAACAAFEDAIKRRLDPNAALADLQQELSTSLATIRAAQAARASGEGR